MANKDGIECNLRIPNLMSPCNLEASKEISLRLCIGTIRLKIERAQAAYERMWNQSRDYNLTLW